MMLRPRVHHLVRLSPFFREPEEFLPSVRPIGCDPNKPTTGKAAENSAQIPAIDLELSSQDGSSGFAFDRQLAQYPAFHQGEGTLQKLLLKDANMLGVEAIEVAHRCNGLVSRRFSH